jgi:hypothetical protein
MTTKFSKVIWPALYPFIDRSNVFFPFSISVTVVSHSPYISSVPYSSFVNSENLIGRFLSPLQIYASFILTGLKLGL